MPQGKLDAAARLITDTRKYDRGLSTLIHDQLHWLNVPERVEYELAVMVPVGRITYIVLAQTLNHAQPTVMVRRCLVSGQLLHSSRRRCQSTSTISQPAPLDCSAVST